jgi:phage terminase small subunit
MTELDGGALARYAVIWCLWVEVEADVKRRGPIVSTEGGNIIQNPFLSVANRCLMQMAQIESEFGLSHRTARASAPLLPPTWQIRSRSTSTLARTRKPTALACPVELVRRFS